RRRYLYGGVDTQLRPFASFTSRVVSPPPPPHPRRGLRQLPTDFLVEVIDASGKAYVAPESRHGIAPPVVPAARLHGPDTPFTAPAADGSGHLWRGGIRAGPRRGARVTPGRPAARPRPPRPPGTPRPRPGRAPPPAL